MSIKERLVTTGLHLTASSFGDATLFKAVIDAAWAMGPMATITLLLGAPMPVRLPSRSAAESLV